jgi:hypothetical protein
MAWDWWDNNMPSFLGGGGGSADASKYLDVASAINPALTGIAGTANTIGSSDPSAVTGLASSIGGTNWDNAVSGGGLQQLSNALNTLTGGGTNALGSGKSSDAKVSPPQNRLPGYSQMQSAQYHPGSAASGLSNNLEALAAIMKTKGLLGL